MFEADDPALGRVVFLRGLRSSLGRVPLWLLSWFVPLLFALVLAVPWGEGLGAALAHRYEPGSVLGSMDETFRADQSELLGVLNESSASAAAFLAFLAFLGGIFAAGGWLQVFLERTEGHSLRRFLWGGARYFWRFLRVAILTLLSLSLLTWLVHGGAWKWMLEFWFGAKDGDLEVVESELTAVWIGWIQAGLYAALFALVLTWGDYTRTRLALFDTRSALWAGSLSWALIFRHPVRTLRPLFLILLFEVAVIALLGKLSWGVNGAIGPESSWLAVALLFALGQAGLLWQAISRGARYAAAVRVSRALVTPPATRDPWASRVGGPGGPQYPVDDTDDYGVSI